MMVFKFFCIFNVSKSSSLLLWKLLLILNILPESTSESCPLPHPPNETGGNSKGIESLNSAFENADSQSSTCFQNSFQNIWVWGGSALIYSLLLSSWDWIAASAMAFCTVDGEGERGVPSSSVPSFSSVHFCKTDSWHIKWMRIRQTVYRKNKLSKKYCHCLDYPQLYRL